MKTPFLVVVGLLLVGTAVGPAIRAEPEATGDLQARPDYDGFDDQLAELIEAMLTDSPRIQAARATSLASFERAPQKRALPDPTISYRYFAATPETRVGPQLQAVEMSQAFPWSGKRGVDAQRADAVATGVAWRVRDLERSLIARLKQIYFDAAYLQEALHVNAEETALLQRFESIALTRYSTGQGNQQNVVKVQTDISRLADQRHSLRLQLDASTRRIAELTGAPEAALALRPISLPLVVFRLDPGRLERDSLDEHPSARAAEQQIAADALGLRREMLASRPDFKLGLSYVDVRKREDEAGTLLPPEGNGKDIWAVSLGFNLPIHRRSIRAGRAEAQQVLLASERTLETTRDRLRFDVQEATLRVESLAERARLYEEVIVPQAGEALASTEAAYTTGRQNFLDLLDAERVLFQVRLTSHRLLADYWIAIADLEAGLGRGFPGEGDRR
jgi:cobalt-zinc-cadmium efflux system outer membrane protein